MTTYAEEHWTAAAACAGDGRFTADNAAPVLLEELQAVCACCPVQVECDAFALDVEATWGCWAGAWRTPQTLAASRAAA